MAYNLVMKMVLHLILMWSEEDNKSQSLNSCKFGYISRCMVISESSTLSVEHDQNSNVFISFEDKRCFAEFTSSIIF